jgi:hypothetical protein
MNTESDASNSTLPSYLRNADFTSQHTHSSFGHGANGLPLLNNDDGSPDEDSAATVERSNSKIRRKPVPTYSTSTIGGNREGHASMASLAASSNADDHSPFSDVHEATEATLERHAAVPLDQEEWQETHSNPGEETMADSPTLPDPHLHTPVNLSRTFPVSVYSSMGDSPAQRVLLETSRDSLTEEQKKELYKLSVQIPSDDRGFRVSF